MLHLQRILFASILLYGCTIPNPVADPRDGEDSEEYPQKKKDLSSRIIREGEELYVTGLSLDAAAMSRRGTLFVATLPIKGTSDYTRVALLKALGSATTVGSRTVPVVETCRVLDFGDYELGNVRVEPLMIQSEVKVGQCVAKIINEGELESGAQYVTLDVGSGEHLMPGDEYVLLGTPIVTDGAVPLAFDTFRDGRCQLPEERSMIQQLSVRCIVVKRPADRKSLRNDYAIFAPRTPRTNTVLSR